MRFAFDHFQNNSAVWWLHSQLIECILRKMSWVESSLEYLIICKRKFNATFQSDFPFYCWLFAENLLIDFQLANELNLAISARKLLWHFSSENKQMKIYLLFELLMSFNYQASTRKTSNRNHFNSEICFLRFFSKRSSWSNTHDQHWILFRSIRFKLVFHGEKKTRLKSWFVVFEWEKITE